MEINDRTQALMDSLDRTERLISTRVATQDQMSQMLQLLERVSLQQTMTDYMCAKLDGHERILQSVKQQMEQASVVHHTLLTQQSLADDSADTSLRAVGSHGQTIVARVSTLYTQAYNQLCMLQHRLTQVLMLIAFMLPAVQRFIRTLGMLSRSLNLLSSSDIRLEDAIGRTMSLPYEHFRYWPVLRARIQQAFADLPGAAKIKRDEFRIVD